MVNVVQNSGTDLISGHNGLAEMIMMKLVAG